MTRRLGLRLAMLMLPSAVLFSMLGCVPVLESGDTDDGEWLWEAPDNGWPSVEPPNGTVGEGFYVEQTIPDFRLPDQHADTVAMWQFFERVTVVDISTMWCGPCQALAEDTETTYLDFEPLGFTYITVLAENIEGSDPSNADLNTWGDYYGISAPIVADLGKEWSGSAVPNAQYPLVLVVDEELVVRERMFAPTDEELRAAIERVME